MTDEPTPTTKRDGQVLASRDLDVLSKQIVGLHRTLERIAGYVGMLLLLQVAAVVLAFLIGNGTIEPPSGF